MPQPEAATQVPRELAFCAFCNRGLRWRLVARFFAVISYLGNWPFWVACAAFAALQAPQALVHLAIASVVCWAIYRPLKGRTARPRPLQANPNLIVPTAPLDEYSFPSGHTLFAVALSLVLIAWLPALFWLVLPFTFLVAISRIVLGLHYPSDVAVGIVLGLAVGSATLSLEL